MFKYFAEDKLAQENGVSASITMKNWIMLLLINLLSLIPFVGVIVSLVILCILAFNDTTATSISNFLKASLLFAVISVVIWLLIFIVFGSVISASIFGSLLGRSL